MTVPATMSRPAGWPTGSASAIAVTASARGQLLAEAEHHASTLARCTAALVTASPESWTDLRRGLHALEMYTARAALEEIELALARVEDGVYGICLACRRPIAPGRLATIPQARFCAACPSGGTLAAADRGEPRLGPSRGELTGSALPVRSLRQLEPSHAIAPEDNRGHPVQR